MKIFEEIKVQVNQGWGDFKQIWLIKRVGDKRYNGYLKKGDIVWKEVIEGTSTDDLIPFMRVPSSFWQEIVNAMAEQTPPLEEKAIDAELKATKYHLADMRKLLKIK